MSLRRTMIGGALVLLPALIIGAVSLRLARHEEERLQRLAEDAGRARLRALSVEIESVAAALRRDLHARLRALPAETAAEELASWRRVDPLIRHAFLLRPDEGVRLLPDPARGITVEEADFLRVFEPLFAGRAPWIAPLPETNGGGAPPPPGEGWIPWFAGADLRPLVWARLDDGRVAGVEIEMTTLLARLLPLLPGTDAGDEAFALLDGSDAVKGQSGAADVVAGARLVAVQPVGSSLPHWRAAFYSARPPGPAPGVRLATRLMVLATVATLLAGGGVLLRESWRNALDARRKTTFVSNVSHELKTPLTTIRMYADLLGEGRVADGAKREQYLATIASESERLTRLINNVLDFSRMEEGRKQYRLADLDVASVARDVVERERVRYTAAGLRLDARLPDGPAKARYDRDALEQALLNLLDNALKYARSGGAVEVALEREGACWRIDVLDRGPGIPPAHRERVFEKFHRVDDSLTAAVPGSGLGLSIARRLARDLGGDLVYRPRPDGGAWFALCVPAADGEGMTA